MSALPEVLKRLEDLDEAWAQPTAARQLEAVRSGAAGLKAAIKATGKTTAVQTFDTSDLLYPAAYGLSGAAAGWTSNLVIRNRMQIVQVESEQGLLTILVNPTEPHRAKEVPFVRALTERYGESVTRMLEGKLVHGDVAGHLGQAGIAPEDVDFILFDHHHTQDVRSLLGTTVPEPGRSEPTPALLPNARLIIQRAELDTYAQLHPHQAHWYVADGVLDVPESAMVVIEGDYSIGAGLAVVRTPGHTYGNQSAVIHTDSGLWTVSENGIAAECYAPEHSRIRKLRDYAREYGLEVVLNGNTRENSLEQYTSMVLEKLLADPAGARPEFPQHFPSSELVSSILAPGIRPTFCHTAITHGALRTS